MSYGTLEIVTEYGQDYFQIKAPYEIELMIQRMIPDHSKAPLQVRVQPENTQIIRMVTKEFPLEIKTDKWEKVQEEILKRDKLAEVVSKLDYIEPDEVHFNGKLFPFQKQCLDFLIKTNGITLVTDEMGLGKAQPLDAKILTPDGWKTMGEIKIGDVVINETGDNNKVKNIFPQGIKEIYKVKFSDGSFTECCDEHLWSISSRGKKHGNRKIWKVLPLFEIRKEIKDEFNNSKYFIPMVEPIKFKKQKLTIDPYTLGVLIGDGTLSAESSVTLSSGDKEIINNLREVISKNGLILKQIDPLTYDYRIIKIDGKRFEVNWLVNELKNLNLHPTHSYSKFIPENYKISSINDRISLLQGLLDTDGYISKDGMTLQYTTISPQLVNDVKFIIQSLGGTARTSEKTPQYTYKGKKTLGKKAYTLTISLPPEIMPFRLSRKRERFVPKTKYKPYRAIKSIDYVGMKEAKCIQVTGTKKMYVTDDFIVTHNTIETLAFISKNPTSLPVVIIAPLVTLINWKREIEKFITLTDQRPDNQQTLAEKRMPVISIIRDGNVKGKKPLKPADFYIINYELVSRRYKDLCGVNPKVVIMDEVHSLRNDHTEKYKSCNAICRHSSVNYKIGLSGTPIYNRGIEMYNICEILKPGLLGERTEFIRRYCRIWDSTQSSEEGKVALSNVLKKSIMIRRKKIDVLKDLPEKIRLKQEIPIDTSLYEEKLEDLYEKIEEARSQLSSQENNEQGMKEGLFELNKRIREMRVAERQIAGLAKAPHVVDYLANLLQDYEEEKFVVFCHHRSVHQAIYDGLWKYNPVQVIGGQSDKERQISIDRFQNKEDCRVIICGLRAGNMGINLTSSAYVIFAELDWSPSVHRQAEDRLHRIGQKHQVFAHYLEGSGTFDEILSQSLLNKTVEISNALGDKVEHMNNKMAVEFLEKKFKLRDTSVISQLITNEK